MNIFMILSPTKRSIMFIFNFLKLINDVNEDENDSQDMPEIANPLLEEEAIEGFIQESKPKQLEIFEDNPCF